MEVESSCHIEKIGRCTRPYVPIVVKNVRFHSNLILTGQSIVEIVGQREDQQGDVDTSLHILKVTEIQ